MPQQAATRPSLVSSGLSQPLLPRLLYLYALGVLFGFPPLVGGVAPPAVDVGKYHRSIGTFPDLEIYDIGRRWVIGHG